MWWVDWDHGRIFLRSISCEKCGNYIFFWVNFFPHVLWYLILIFILQIFPSLLPLFRFSLQKYSISTDKSGEIIVTVQVRNVALRLTLSRYHLLLTFTRFNRIIYHQNPKRLRNSRNFSHLKCANCLKDKINFKFHFTSNSLMLSMDFFYSFFLIQIFQTKTQQKNQVGLKWFLLIFIFFFVFVSKNDMFLFSKCSIYNEKFCYNNFNQFSFLSYHSIILQLWNEWIFQGDLTQQEKRAVFLTVHDLGCNRELNFPSRLSASVIDFSLFPLSCTDSSFQDFVNSPCMSEIKERSCFIHVDVPGHADNAGALSEKWGNFHVKLQDHEIQFPIIS